MKTKPTNEHLVAIKDFDNLLWNNRYYIRKLAKKYKRLDIDVNELCQVGSIGLYEAMNKYDPTRGTKFMYFASFYIKKEMLARMQDYDNLIYVPRYAKKINNYTPYTIISADSCIDQMNKPIIFNIADDNIKEEMNTIDKEFIKAEIAKLTEIESKIVTLFISEQRPNMVQIGKELNLNRQTIYNILEKAMKKLSKSKELKQLYFKQ